MAAELMGGRPTSASGTGFAFCAFPAIAAYDSEPDWCGTRGRLRSGAAASAVAGEGETRQAGGCCKVGAAGGEADAEADDEEVAEADEAP